MVAFCKTLLHGVGGLLFASFLFFMYGLLGQCFLGQNVILQQTQQWLSHEEIILNHLLKKPHLVQFVQTFFNQPVLSASQNLAAPNALVKWHTLKTSPKTDKLKNLLQTYRQRLQVSQEIFCHLLEVAILRLWVVLLFLPLLGLFGAVGFIDGLTQRHLRKRQGARESSVLYQRAKDCLKPSLFGAGILYVGLPMCLNPLPLFLLFSLLFSVTLAMAARTYKKYL